MPPPEGRGVDSTWLKRFRELKCAQERELFAVGAAPQNVCECGLKCHTDRCIACISRGLDALRSPHHRKTLDEKDSP